VEAPAIGYADYAAAAAPSLQAPKDFRYLEVQSYAATTARKLQLDLDEELST